MRQETIKVVRLDDLFDHSGERILLKIDTQGFEREVLDGATGSLKSIDGVLLELPVVHLYQGTWGLEEAFGYMNDRGFMLSQITPVNFPWMIRYWRSTVCSAGLTYRQRKSAHRSFDVLAGILAASSQRPCEPTEHE